MRHVLDEHRLLTVSLLGQLIGVGEFLVTFHGLIIHLLDVADMTLQ